MPGFRRDTIIRQVRRLGEPVADIVTRVRVKAGYECRLEVIRDAAAGGLKRGG